MADHWIKHIRPYVSKTYVKKPISQRHYTSALKEVKEDFPYLNDYSDLLDNLAHMRLHDYDTYKAMTTNLDKIAEKRVRADYGKINWKFEDNLIALYLSNPVRYFEQLNTRNRRELNRTKKQLSSLKNVS